MSVAQWLTAVGTLMLETDGPSAGERGLGVCHNEFCNRGDDVVFRTVIAVIGERAARRERHPSASVDDDLRLVGVWDACQCSEHGGRDAARTGRTRISSMPDHEGRYGDERKTRVESEDVVVLASWRGVGHRHGREKDDALQGQS